MTTTFFYSPINYGLGRQSSVIDYSSLQETDTSTKKKSKASIIFNDKMLKVFKEKYAQEKSKNHVAWEERKQTKSIRFYAEVGNNILLLWDSLQEK